MFYLLLFFKTMLALDDLKNIVNFCHVIEFFLFSLFCKLASLLRVRLAAFGPDVRIAVRCLQVLVKGIDAK